MESVGSAKDFGIIIRAKRKQFGYTQLKVAHIAGVGINFVSDLENGKPTCELEKSIRVAQTLGIDLFAQSRGE